MVALSARKKFCSDLRSQIKDESNASGEYEALALDALHLSLPSSDVASILFEKIRDDEKSHKETLEKLMRSVCPIK